MCNFPITVRGELDGDPVFRVGRRDFPRIFAQYLKQGVFSANEELEFIRRTTAVPNEHHMSERVRRVGDMIFRNTDKGWLLDTLYLQSTLD
jgi:hypothetical protein